MCSGKGLGCYCAINFFSKFAHSEKQGERPVQPAVNPTVTGVMAQLAQVIIIS